MRRRGPADAVKSTVVPTVERLQALSGPDYIYFAVRYTLIVVLCIVLHMLLNYYVLTPMSGPRDPRSAAKEYAKRYQE
mgnify:CR=1 FL=1